MSSQIPNPWRRGPLKGQKEWFEAMEKLGAPVVQYKDIENKSVHVVVGQPQTYANKFQPDIQEENIFVFFEKGKPGAKFAVPIMPGDYLHVGGKWTIEHVPKSKAKAAMLEADIFDDFLRTYATYTPEAFGALIGFLKPEGQL